jgi:hypothetical protein
MHDSRVPKLACRRHPFCEHVPNFLLMDRPLRCLGMGVSLRSSELTLLIRLLEMQSGLLARNDANMPWHEYASLLENDEHGAELAVSSSDADATETTRRSKTRHVFLVSI